MSRVIELRKPCCSSVRECAVRFHAVIRLSDAKVVETIDAVRCYRLKIVPTYKVKVDNNTIVVEHYVSNRGNIYIDILYKPDKISEEDARKVALQALGYLDDP